MTLNKFIKKYKIELIASFFAVALIFSALGAVQLAKGEGSLFQSAYAKIRSVGMVDDSNPELIAADLGGIKGYHDNNDNSSCSVSGWAAFSTDRETDVSFKIYATKQGTSNEILVAQGLSNKQRTDLEQAGVCTGGTCAIAENLSSKLESGVTYNIRVVGIDKNGNEVDLNRTNKEITCGTPTTPPACLNSNPARDLTYNGINVSNGYATTRVTNQSANCSYTVGLASYEAYMNVPDPNSPEFIDFVKGQTLYAKDDQRQLAPGQSVDLRVALSKCTVWQVDLFSGPKALTNPYVPDLEAIGYHILDAKFGGTLNSCTTNPPPPTTCTNPNVIRDIEIVKSITINNGKTSATASVRNKSNVCTYRLGLASYEAEVMPTPDFQKFINTQTLYKSDMKDVGPGATANFSVGLPSCSIWQVDLFSGPNAPVPPDFDNLPGYHNFEAKLGDNFTNCPVEQPDLNVVCYASSSSVDLGDSVTFTANATGGNGSYSYSWGGDVSGGNRTVTKTFNSIGTKNATVTVTSNGQSDTATCHTVVKQVITDTINGSCISTPSVVNIGDNVNWSAAASGGNGSYSYSWSGAVSGSGQNKNTSYSTSGTKNAVVTISSGGEYITRNCSVVVRESQQSNLSAYCSASPSSVRPNENINWIVYPSGGNGSYTYSWSGDVSGNGSSVSRAYSQTGTKYATVTVTSGGQSVQTNCQAQVYEQSLNVSCGVNSSTYQVGNNVNWYSNVSGGNGSYYYSWSGSDGLSGNSSSVNRSYGSVGTKNATVTVTSGGQSASATCQTYIGNNVVYENSLNVSCSANPNLSQINQSVNWNANASGGNGSYSYYWSGTDGLSSNSSNTQRSYSSVGIKNATVTVISGNQTASATCSTNVFSQYSNPGPIGLTSLPIPGPGTLSSVYLDQIPYTGIVSNMSKATAMFLLLFWSAGLAFVGLQFAKRKRELAMAGVDTANRETPWTVLKNAIMPGAIQSPYHDGEEEVSEENAETPEQGEDMEEEDEEVEEEDGESISNLDLEALSKLAISKKALVSKQALQRIYDREEANFENASMELLKIIDQSVLVYPREDGWVILNSERLESVESQTIS